MSSGYNKNDNKPTKNFSTHKQTAHNTNTRSNKNTLVDVIAIEQQLDALLNNHASLFDLSINAEQIQQLALYLALLVKWNRAYNLTAIHDPQEMLIKHILDSLVIAKYIHSDTLIDVGTGAGLPGIPLAIVFPHKDISVLDSNGKKTRFLQQVRSELDLSRVNVIHSRVEDYSQKCFEGVLSRAFSSLVEMLNVCQHLCAEDGRFYAMKGIYPEQEIQVLQNNALKQEVRHFQVEQCIPLVVPELEAERHLLIIK